MGEEPNFCVSTHVWYKIYSKYRIHDMEKMANNWNILVWLCTVLFQVASLVTANEQLLTFNT